MKRIFWFATGIAAGLAVAKQLRENPEAKAAVDEAAKRARAIGESFTAGYREREAQLNAPKRSAKASAGTPKKPAARKAVAAKPASKKPAAKKSAAKPSTK